MERAPDIFVCVNNFDSVRISELEEALGEGEGVICTLLRIWCSLEQRMFLKMQDSQEQ